MEIVVKVKPHELTHELVDNIRALLDNKRNVEITITINDKVPNENLFGDPETTYETRLNKSISDIENDRDLVSFTVEEFKKFASRSK